MPEASGTAAGGQGTAAAKVQASLAENGEGTTVSVITDLMVTGKPAQFGRGLIEDVGKKIVGQFADCLSKSLAPAEEPWQVAATPPPPATASQEQPGPGQPAPVQSAPPRLMPPPVTDEIDLLDAAGAVAKRAIPGLLVDDAAGLLEGIEIGHCSPLVLTHVSQADGEVIGRAQGVGVVLAEDAAVAGEGVLVQGAGLLVLTRCSVWGSVMRCSGLTCALGVPVGRG